MANKAVALYAVAIKELKDGITITSLVTYLLSYTNQILRD